ncbi:hypothetical protein [Nodosilinea nodulosa]|uniref:hypothetical protein n=1 Tax=Nodosilinea nodulosa TaxID=416001 RepID=UPI0002DF83F0|nr:hypothetical protein [Nodosilinea nodulosa]
MVRAFKIFLATIIVLGLVFAALPAFLQVLNVPAFSVGDGPFLLLRWRNDAAGSGISFNLLPFGLLAVGIGVVVYGVKRRYSS